LKNRGTLIAFEGIDGSGKGTQLRLLYDWLDNRDIPVIRLAQPSDSMAGRILRELAVRNQRLNPDVELSLFIRDRREQARSTILPFLGRGYTVLLDRHYLSSVAYQGARGLDPEEILKRNLRVAPEPDLTFLIDVDPSIALDRIERTRNTDAFERYDYLTSVRMLYLEWADRLKNVLRIDGNTGETDIHFIICSTVRRLLEC